MILAVLVLSHLLALFVWISLAVMSFWIWKSAKAAASLLTMVGAAFLAVVAFCLGFGIGEDLMILGAIGPALVVLGYYLTVKPTIDARVRELSAKAQERAAAGGSPPSQGTPGA